MNIRSYRWTSAASILSLALLLVSAARIARADAITQWNATMCNMGANGLPPFMESRVYAMAHLAMLEALRDATTPPSSTNPHLAAEADAAIAAAAHTVLVAELPMGSAVFDAAYAAALAAILASPARVRGIQLGETAGDAILAKRATDDPFGRLLAPYTPGSGPGAYQPTPPRNFVVGAGWATMPTFILKSNDQFRAPKPYTSLASLDYAMDVNEIQAIGRGPVAPGRTAVQTAIALFWYENSSVPRRIIRNRRRDQQRRSTMLTRACSWEFISGAPAPRGWNKAGRSDGMSWRKRNF